MQQSEKHKTSFPDIPEIPQLIRQKRQADSFSDEPRPSAPVPPPLPGSMGAVELGGRGNDSDLPKAYVSALHSRSFPTEQRSRQKARKQAGHAAKKRPQVVEDHHDGCGKDFSPLGEEYVVTSYYEHLQSDHPQYSQYSGEVQYTEENYCSLDWYCGMNGCDYVPDNLGELCENGTPVVFDDIEAFARWDASKAQIGVVSGASRLGTSSDAHAWVVHDVAELCGGVGDTAALLVKRGYANGPNFDIIVGTDLVR